MDSLFKSETRSGSTRAAIHDWVWDNLPRIAIVLASITSLCSLAWIILGPARSPNFLEQIGDSSLALTALLIAFYFYDVFWGLSRARDFWMNKEKGFFTVVAALFFSEGFHGLRLFAQNHRFDREVIEGLVVFAVLWSAQYWKSKEAKELATVLVVGPDSESAPNELTGLGLSSQSNVKSDGPLA